MKFNCDYFKQRKQAKRDRTYNEFVEQYKWHTWYAWFPVKVAEGDCRWFEHVQRKVNDYSQGYWLAFHRQCWVWEYRALPLTLPESE